MKITRLLLWFLAVLPLSAAEKADIILNDGRVLKAALIASIGEKTVAIVYEGGVITVPLDGVPAGTVARARASIAAKSSAKAELASDLAKQDAEAREQKRAGVVAMAQARREEIKPAASTNPGAEQKLIEQKGKFPPKRVEKVRATAQQIIEVDVPHVDLWSSYRSSVMTASLQSLPITLDRLEKQIQSDVLKLKEQAERGSGQTAKHQASSTLTWINSALRPYLAQLRALAAR
jgi:hypothetical protein